MQSIEEVAKPPAAREPFWENAKLFLMVLVVCGHALEPWLLLDRPLDAVYLWIYSFHMAAFAFISGRFSKADWSKKGLISTALALLLPYAIFQLIYGLMAAGAWQGEPLVLEWHRPHWILWFLVSLFTWRLLLPAVAKLPWAGTVLVLVALAAGMSDRVEHAFSLSRTLVFFPFFYAGYRLGDRASDWAALPPVRAAALVLTGVSAAVAWFLAPTFDLRWLYGSNPYRWLEVGRWEGVAIRLAVMAAAAVMGLVFLAWVPRHRLRFTAMGSRTLTIFLLHGLVVKSWVTWGGALAITDEEWTGYRVPIVLGWGFVMTLLLGAPQAAWLMRPLVEPVRVWNAWRGKRAAGETA